MSGTLANKEVNVLQAVNLTLGTSVFVALADALPRMVNRQAPISFGRIFYIALLIFWGVKLLVENHRSFKTASVNAHPRYSVFQLAMTIAMFVPLIVSAKIADVLQDSAFLLAISLFAGLIWLVGLIIYFACNGGFRPRDYKWEWMISAAVTVGGGLWIALAGLAVDSWLTIALIVAMLATGIWDAKRTKSFSL